MKCLVVLAALAAFATADVIKEVPDWTTAWNYMERIGIPEAERIREAEEKYLSSRITGGSPAVAGEYPYQAGLISDIINIIGNGVCGGSLISESRVLTAAHCWSDGVNQAWRFEVVLGSVLLFSGGTRMYSEDVVMHSDWSTLLIRNDIAIVRLPEQVSFSDVISPIALPSADDLSDTFAGEIAVASGFGRTADNVGITLQQFLSGVTLPVISNLQCRLSFPFHVIDSNICVSGADGKSTCGGDSGGPLVVTKNDNQILVGITSFGSAFGCTIGLPAVFVRVTSFMDWINSNL